MTSGPREWPLEDFRDLLTPIEIPGLLIETSVLDPIPDSLVCNHGATMNVIHRPDSAQLDRTRPHWPSGYIFDIAMFLKDGDPNGI